MNALPPPPSDDATARRLAQVEQRLARLEAQLGFAATATADPSPAPAGATVAVAPAEEDLEFQVGQTWFARIGIIVLALGAGFTLSLPFASLPAGGPSLIGYALAAGFFLLAHLWRETFALIAGQLRGVAMSLLFFATLRLYFFSPRPLLATDTALGQSVLVLAVAANLAIAWRRRCPWLLSLGLVTGCLTTLAVGSAGFVLPGLVGLSLLAVGISTRGGWPALWLAAIPAIPATGLIWAVNDPLLGRALQWAAVPAAGPLCLLAAMAILATGPLWSPPPAPEEGLPNAGALLNCLLGYGLFLALTLLAPGGWFVPYHLLAAAVFLGLAALFRIRQPGEVPPFLYAMTGNLALSLAILRSFAVPEVFVWLSLQSILVVTAAIWFRSRFIVVANFLIYAAIVLAYGVLAERETGISVGFGLVALASARLLHWQKDRLELKTELMRNAYLFGAFAVFPYALYHLVPVRQVGFAWMALALFYYLMNLVVRSPKFRWMGHVTLLLTTVYLLMVGTRQFGPVYRVLSFLVLGTVLVAVSLLFTRQRRRPPSAAGT